MASDIALNWFLAISLTLFGLASIYAMAYASVRVAKTDLGARAVSVFYAIVMVAMLCAIWGTDRFNLF